MFCPHVTIFLIFFVILGLVDVQHFLLFVAKFLYICVQYTSNIFLILIVSYLLPYIYYTYICVCVCL